MTLQKKILKTAWENFESNLLVAVWNGILWIRLHCVKNFRIRENADQRKLGIWSLSTKRWLSSLNLFCDRGFPFYSYMFWFWNCYLVLQINVSSTPLPTKILADFQKLNMKNISKRHDQEKEWLKKIFV